jgi:DNA-directed RNA polymerase subunit M/transcription elongation factor TFIIS
MSEPPPFPTSDAPPPLPPGDVPVPALPGVSPSTPAQAPPPQDSPVTGVDSQAALLSVACKSCGSQMVYEPGTTMLKCQACGAEQPIENTETIDEHSYDEWASRPEKRVATIGKQVLKCQGCGATTETDELAGACQFCGGVLLAVSNPEGLIAPEAVLPFGIVKKDANAAFGKWVRSRWFAPNALKKVGSTEAITGTYVPHWTYDAQTATHYTGERGEHYYTTETRTVNGRTETYQVQHTRWWPASGDVSRAFDDVVVPASDILEQQKLDKMGPWTLAQSQAFEPQYLAGYTAVRYDIDPDTGLVAAKGKMEDVIRDDCRRDIGGDEQRVSSMSVQYAAMMFKLLLLPIWIASYVYAGKTYQVLVNANTAEVVGDRPYSKVKIALAVIAAIIVIAVGIAVYVHVKHNEKTTTALAFFGIG